MLRSPTQEELEEVHGAGALQWVRAQNIQTQEALEKDKHFSQNQKAAFDILTAKDKIAYGSPTGDWVYNFWQDDTYPRGVWRRTTREDYLSSTPHWDNLLDISQLNAAEGESWVFHGVKRLLPEGDTVLLGLSRGGKDATVYREYDVKQKAFVVDGFVLPEAETHLNWIDSNRLLIGTDFGEDSLSKSGYPRQLRVLKRGQKLTDAELLAECAEDDMGLFGWVSVQSDQTYRGYEIQRDFYHSEKYLLIEKDQGWQQIKLPLPDDAAFCGMFKGKAIAVLKSDWDTEQGVFKQGSVVSLTLNPSNSETYSVSSIFESTSAHSVPSVHIAKDKLYIEVLENVQSVILETSPIESGWDVKEVMRKQGTLSIIAGDNLKSDEVWLSYQDFLTPPSLMRYQPGEEAAVMKQSPERFDSSKLTVQQYFATSKDGTQVPYFVVHPKGMKLNGQNPTLLNAYGGFEISRTPSYMAVKGKLWLEQGGVFVLANIRGGGEFGPQWHRAGLKTHRQCVYDDFAAVARDLIDKKITSPEHLGAQGGSNGGLLMGVALTQYPELFNAIVCQVPLLDMLRFHLLLKGDSWVGEYGHPDNPEERAVLESYSPLHNLKSGQPYPKVLFHTSTEDDRVHPGHARKMAAKMAEMGYPFYYFENIEGGHSASADYKQSAYTEALITAYLRRQLCPQVELDVVNDCLSSHHTLLHLHAQGKDDKKAVATSTDEQSNQAKQRKAI